MVEINEDGGVEVELLIVKMVEWEGQPVITWDFTDKQNAYFILGVLDTIKQDLINVINQETDKWENK